jgi:uncharacterized protein
MGLNIDEPVVQKYGALRACLHSLNRTIVAYSGGVDSTLLTFVAFQVLGEQNMLALIGDSPSLPRKALDYARDFLEGRHIPYRIVETRELDNADYAKNPFDRCYFCKQNLFARALGIREELGFHSIAYGFTADDRGDFRPGNRAAQEAQVVSPLDIAGLGKSEIRRLSQALGIPGWDRPAMPCLASRLAYGTPVREEYLRLIEEIEDFLNTQGFRNCRARYDGKTLRLEVPVQDIEKVAAAPWREELVRRCREGGALFVSLDLEGLISGKLNRTIGK